MRFSFLFILFSLNFYAFGQVKPIYFSGEVVVQDSTIATSYGIYGKLSGENLWVLKMYDLYDNLMQTGSYKDENLKIPHGDFIYYSDVYKFNETFGTFFSLKQKSRFIAIKGRFNDGLQTGRWISFFPNGEIKAIVTYVKGLKNGMFSQYSAKGKIEVSGSYLNDEKDGTWVTGRKKELYINGLLQLKN